MDIAPTTAARESAEARSEAGLWWILLITGSLWLVFALIVFQFDARSVNAIALLVGLVVSAPPLRSCLRLCKRTAAAASRSCCSRRRLPSSV